METVFTVIENIQQSSPPVGLADSHAPTTLPAGQSLKFVFGAVFILVLLNYAAFHLSLSGYFLADDFGHVDYLKQVFSGHPELLWKNFYSNWMQTVGTNFYRPFISITLAGDYLLWGANASGFHLTNYLYQTASSIFLFLALNTMFPRLQCLARFSTAFVAAALFACHPLHPEVVSWIIARVDSVCTTFLFLSLWLYLLARRPAGRCARQLNALSLFSFVLSLMSKEMAITLPPTIFVYELINSSMPGQEVMPSRKERIKAAIRASSGHFAVLFLYLVGRAVVLGTLFGGYGGSIGEGLKSSVWKRWFQEGCLRRLLFPFNDALVDPRDVYHSILKVLTGSALALAVFRAAAQRRLAKNHPPSLPCALSPFAVLAIFWSVIALAPTVQVFDITPLLQGGRFVYLATAPVSLFLAALIFGAGDQPPSAQPYRGMPLRTAVSILVSGSLIVAYARLAAINNLPWAHASSALQALTTSLENRLAGKPAPAKIALVNLPSQYQGAHMLYNSAMLAVALKPPLCKTDLSDRVLTFEPPLYGDANLASRQRYKALLNEPNLAGTYRWETWSNQLIALTDWQSQKKSMAPPSVELPALKALTLANTDSLHSPILDLPSADFDFIDFDLKVEAESAAKNASSECILILSWTGTQDPIFGPERQIVKSIKLGDQFQKLRFSVGELKNWITQGRITGLQLSSTLKPVTISIKSARLVCATDQIPALSVAPNSRMQVDSNGVYQTSDRLGPLQYDATRIKNARWLRYEVSLPDYWFEHFSGTFRDTAPSEHVSIHGNLAELSSGDLCINLDKLNRTGYYELRLIALDQDGKAIGYASDPINFKFNFLGQRQRQNPK